MKYKKFNKEELEEMLKEFFYNRKEEPREWDPFKYMTPNARTAIEKELEKEFGTFRNELKVSQWRDDDGGLNIGYGFESDSGGRKVVAQTGIGGVKNMLDQGVFFTHVIFNGSELNKEQTESFWEQFKEMTDAEK